MEINPTYIWLICMVSNKTSDGVVRQIYSQAGYVISFGGAQSGWNFGFHGSWWSQRFFSTLIQLHCRTLFILYMMLHEYRRETINDLSGKSLSLCTFYHPPTPWAVMLISKFDHALRIHYVVICRVILTWVLNGLMYKTAWEVSCRNLPIVLFPAHRLVYGAGHPSSNNRMTSSTPILSPLFTCILAVPFHGDSRSQTALDVWNADW